jgi:hypothetical protein
VSFITVNSVHFSLEYRQIDGLNRTFFNVSVCLCFGFLTVFAGNQIKIALS